MIPVSNEFKKAIKDRERRIKGYVEVLYDAPNVNVEVEVVNMTSANTNPSEISNGIRVENDYGTVDYLPLDGSKLVMGDTNIHSGYISDRPQEETTGPQVHLSFEETTINGVTLYYRDNYPLTTRLHLDLMEFVTLQGEGYVQQIVFDEPKTISEIGISFGDWEYPKRKIKIMEIDLGITHVYKDQDLLEFTVDEEVNKLVEETPTNEVDITLNNMQDIFNPLNPQGIVKFLTENVKIIPYIGVLTENNGVEYVKMGEFFFESYTNNSDKSTTLVGKNLMRQLETKTLEKGLYMAESVFIDIATPQTGSTTQEILSNSGINANIDIYIDQPINARNPYLLRSFDFIDALTFIKKVAIHNFAIFYVDRNDIVQIKSLNFDIVDNITKSEMIEDANFKKIEKVNKVKRYSDYALIELQYDETAEEIETINETVRLTENIQVFAVPKAHPNAVSNDSQFFTLTRIGGTSATIGGQPFNRKYSFIQVTGNIGDEVTLIGTYHNCKLSSEQLHYEHTKENIKQGEKITTLEIDDISSNYGYQHGDYLGQLKYAPSYEMSFEYNGDPSLEAGDYINVETPYGYKSLFIQKNRFTFNGGLTGSIEGVE